MSALIHQRGKYCKDLNVKQINQHLSNGKTRFFGLELLYSHLSQLSNEDFVEGCVNWMQSCCKDGFCENNDYAMTVLNELLKRAGSHSELKKTVSFFITTRYFDYFFKHCSTSCAVWHCTETCLLYFRGACGPFQRMLNGELELQLSKNVELSETILHCVSLLPCLGGGGNDGIDYKINWKQQFLNYLNKCHTIFDDLLSDFEELQRLAVKKHTFTSKGKPEDTENLVIKLKNFCDIISFMLKNNYPVTKSVPIHLVLQLICRGLAINSAIVSKKHTTQTISLKEAFPKICLVVFHLFNCVIASCRSQLLPYSKLVCKLLKQSLDSVLINDEYIHKKVYFLLRVSIYETLCNWLIAVKSGSYCESISKTIIFNVDKDIQMKKVTIHLKESNHDKRKEEFVDSDKSSICYSGLMAMQYFVKFCGPLLKQEEQKFLVQTTLKLLADIQCSSSFKIAFPYSVSICRLQLYHLMWELVNQSYVQNYSSLHLALRIFSRGVNDTCLDVSQFCFSKLNALTNFIHSQFDNRDLFFSKSILNSEISSEMFDCRQDLIKTGSENINKERETIENNPNIQEQSVLGECNLTSAECTVIPGICDKEKTHREKNNDTNFGIFKKRSLSDENLMEHESVKERKKLNSGQIEYDKIENEIINPVLVENTFKGKEKQTYNVQEEDDDDDACEHNDDDEDILQLFNDSVKESL